MLTSRQNWERIGANPARRLGLAVVLSLALSRMGQAQSHSVKEDSLYAKALFASVIEMDKEWGKYSRADQSTVVTDYHHIFVETDPPVTDGLPPESAGYRVEYLDVRGLIARYQKLKKEFAILKIFPIKNEAGRLSVGINVYYFSYKKRHLMYGLSDWSSVEFRFDCDRQEFVISAVKLGGI